MPRRNGPIRVGDLTPELIPCVELIRDDTPVVLRGYVLGPRCPGTVKARVAGVSQDYASTTSVSVTHDDGTTTDEFHHDEGAWRAYHRDLLLAVVVGLEEVEADTLSGETERAQQPLRYLGWLPPLDGDAEQEDDDADDPEVVGGRSTTASSSRSLPPPTDSPRASS